VPKPRFLQHSPDDPHVLPSLEDLTPEEMKDLSPEVQKEIYERALEAERRKQNEMYQDVSHEERQKRKLKKELKGPGKRKHDPLVEKTPEKSQVEKEREMADEFVRKQRGEKVKHTKKQKEEDEELERLMSDPSIIKQKPEGGFWCMRHPDKPAVMLLKHNEMLEEGVPDLPFCESCAFQFKMLPIMENEPSDALLRRLSEKHNILKKLSILANKLDSKNMYADADLIDRIIAKAR